MPAASRRRRTVRHTGSITGLSTAKALGAISAQRAYLDGEPCALAQSGITSFGLLQATTDDRETDSLTQTLSS
jgi:ATP-dependent DNA ligase